MACVRKKLPCVCTMVIFTPQGLITMSSFVSTPSLFFLARAKEKLSACSVDSGTCQSLFLSRRSTSESSSSADIHTCMYDMVGAHMNEHKEGREQVSVWDITHTYDLNFTTANEVHVILKWRGSVGLHGIPARNACCAVCDHARYAPCWASSASASGRSPVISMPWSPIPWARWCSPRSSPAACW